MSRPQESGYMQATYKKRKQHVKHIPFDTTARNKRELFIRFAEDSLTPINETFIKDDSLDTCTSFLKRTNAELHHTHFRIRKLIDQIGDINVTITGNEFMHKITTEGPTYLLRVELRSYEREFIFAEYSNFSIGPESDNYTLHVTGYLKYSTAGDSLKYHNGMMFTTVSRDNDLSGYNCAQYFSAPWWFNSCLTSLLTGKLEHPPCNESGKGIVWRYPWGLEKIANYVRVMIRPIE
ncbi:hypothetical protein LSH36_839g05113 [Paralvinella palmiformis]|uniref:Fibrinogen C-terminal domain-containing protein n=1 Tax=Paralvinella palmiformis TaxID=53620 RepID=A0AAD9MTE4_9ANNE|nr:hypothetical protein LSH36_839g05113 [Paralvinella palmiformis]